MKYLYFLVLILTLTAGVNAQVVSCQVYAYVIDKDPNGLNVRSGAGKKFDILGQIMPDEGGVLIDVMASKNGWMQIENPQTVDGLTAFEGDGWVFASLLATTTRMKTKLYSRPDLKSKSLANLPGEEEYKLVACTGKWAKIQYGKIQGWLAPEAQCGNPVTTCP